MRGDGGQLVLRRRVALLPGRHHCQHGGPLSVRILTGDCRDVLPTLPAASVQCVVTSPPYFGLRDYGVSGQIGLELTPGGYVAELVAVFREVRRLLRDDGTAWLNLGDSYANDGKWGGETGGKQAYLDDNNRKRVGREKRVTGLKLKDLIGIPWRVAFALQADGWWLRSDIIWSKPNSMPESITDRPTKAHEYLFLLAKNERYAYNADAISEDATGTLDRPQQRRARELADAAGLTDRHFAAIRSAGATDAGKAQVTQDGHGKNTDEVMVLAAEAKAALGGYYREFLMSPTRNRRSVWEVPTAPFSEAHFATFPPALIEPCILAGCHEGGTVLDPFGGAGTTGLVADRLGRNAVLIELNPDYVAMAERRIRGDAPLFAEVNSPDSPR